MEMPGFDLRPYVRAFDAAVNAGMDGMTRAGSGGFRAVRRGLDGLFDGLSDLLLLAPFWLLALAVGLLAGRSIGWKGGLASALGMALCHGMGLWEDTLETLSLVLIAVTLAVLIGVPVGIWAGYRARVAALLDPVLDLIQTLPPYLYLLPAIGFLGFGPATAIVATVIVAVAPVIRLTALGFRRTPREFLELGEAVGATPWIAFARLRLPFAMPSIMAGLNQSLMMAFGMVVIAGIVGSGGLGERIYGAVRRLDIALSVNAAIAIVILTIIIDRVSQSTRKERGV